MENFKKLEDFLGPELVRSNSATADVLDEVKKEIDKERKEAAKIEAKKLVLEAMGLRDKAIGAEKLFKSNQTKFNKELGKLMKKIEAGMSGKPIADEPADEPAADPT